MQGYHVAVHRLEERFFPKSDEILMCGQACVGTDGSLQRINRRSLDSPESFAGFARSLREENVRIDASQARIVDQLSKIQSDVIGEHREEVVHIFLDRHSTRSMKSVSQVEGARRRTRKIAENHVTTNDARVNRRRIIDFEA